MPAGQAVPIDKDQVRIVAVAVGVREAARQFGLPEGTVQFWSAKEGWLREQEQVSTVQEQALERKRESMGYQPTSTNAVDVLAKYNGETRLGHATAAAKVAGKLQQMDADELFISAPLLAQHAKHASTIFGWGQSDLSVAVRLDVIASGQDSCPVIDMD